MWKGGLQRSARDEKLTFAANRREQSVSAADSRAGDTLTSMSAFEFCPRAVDSRYVSLLLRYGTYDSFVAIAEMTSPRAGGSRGGQRAGGMVGESVLKETCGNTRGCLSNKSPRRREERTAEALVDRLGLLEALARHLAP